MSGKTLIYAAEDDTSIRELLECTVEASGYLAETFERAEELLGRMAERKPDLVLLDIMLPGMDGMETLSRIRAEYGQLPVILVTAKGTELDKVRGLESGADDYITKPFGVLELIARIRARLKKRGPEVLEINGVRLDEARRETEVNGTPLTLTVKEFDLLCHLMRNAGSVMRREELLNTVWGYDYLGETRTLDMHIMSLRSKLGDGCAAGEYRYISTVRGVGYVFKRDRP